MDDGGARDERARGEGGEASRRQTTLDEDTAQPEATAGGEFANAFGA
jgi:hypothetical protein